VRALQTIEIRERPEPESGAGYAGVMLEEQLVRQAQRELSLTVSQASVDGEQAEAYFFLFGCAFFLR